MRNLVRGFFVFLLMMAGAVSAQAQTTTGVQKSGKKAFALSLILPGLGHQYAHDGWSRTALFFSTTDISLILGLVNAQWREGDLIQNYETLGALEAGAQVKDKSRAFFLNLGAHTSSNAYVDFLLRTRNWDRLATAEDPAFTWQWTTEDGRLQYRALRDDAETFGRRVTLFTSMLVANRLIAGLTSIRAVRKQNNRTLQTTLSLRPPPGRSALPIAHVSLRW
jgi:hypothetical protein